MTTKETHYKPMKTLMKPYLLLLCYALSSAAYGAAPQENSVALSVDFQGVWTNPNQHSKVPVGAARRAENVVNPRPGVATTVPGQENLTSAYEETDERFSSGISYQGMIVESTSATSSDPRLYVRDTGADTLTPESGSFEPPSGVERIPFAVAGEKLYMATSDGVKVKDGVGEAPAVVGLPAPLTEFAGATGGTGAFVPPSSSVAFRTTYRRADAGGVMHESAPSGRAVYYNAGGSDALPYVYTVLSDAIVAGDVLRVYRTGVASGTAPGDVMFLTEDYTITSGDVAAGYVSIDDATPDELRGEPLYTNATSQGISRQNEPPPMAKVILGFDDSLLLGNVQGPQRFTFRLLAVPDAGDVFTIAGLTFTADISDDYPNGIFVPYSAGTVSEDIEETSRRMIRAFNEKTTNSAFTAQYASSESDPPGIIALEATGVSDSAFTAIVDANGERYEPQLSVAQTSTATIEPNGLWVSKRGLHDSFPPLRGASATYRFRVGVKGNPILAMVPLREAVIVFVQNEGVWKVKRTGAEGWRVDQINNNAHLLVPGSVAVVDNQALALTTRGLVAVDEGGVEEIDLPIKDKIDAIKALSPTVVQPYTFAVSDEARLRYTLYHPLTNSSTNADHAWVYNADQGTWTERTDPASGGLVGEEDGLLYLGDASSNHLTRERTGTASQVYKTPANAPIPVRIDWTVMDEGDPGAEKHYQELRLLTADEITGSVTFECTNDLKGTESTTGETSDDSDGEPYVRAWVPDGCRRTSRLKVSVQRDVFEEAFEVVGMKAIVAGMYDGAMTR